MPDSEGIKFTVEFYKTDKGNMPDKEWLKSLPPEYKKLIGNDIKTIQYGFPNDLPKDLVKYLGKGLYECRTNLPDGIARVIFCQSGSEIFILNAFIKKRQKTDPAEINKALRRKGKLNL